MRIQKLLKINNKIKKSHILLFGSLLVFIGTIFLFKNYYLRIKDEIYSEMRISMMDIPEINDDEKQEINIDVPNAENIDNTEETKNYVIDYSKYLGVLEIPKIYLKRGFYNTDSRYNNIQYNVTLVEGSTMPDVPNGNLILMAHSGDAYISYFAYLYKLGIGDVAYITYLGNKYQYQIIDIYEVPKTGLVTLKQYDNKTILTMITCTKDNDSTQTVYIAELIG